MMTDEAWLTARLPDASQDEIEAFCERVAIRLEDSVPPNAKREEAARVETLGEIVARRECPGWAA